MKFYNRLSGSFGVKMIVFSMACGMFLYSSKLAGVLGLVGQHNDVYLSLFLFFSQSAGREFGN